MPDTSPHARPIARIARTAALLLVLVLAPLVSGAAAGASGLMDGARPAPGAAAAAPADSAAAAAAGTGATRAPTDEAAAGHAADAGGSNAATATADADAGAGAGAGATDAAGEAAAEAAAAGERFDVWEYRIAGNTRLPTQTVERVVYPFLGPKRSLDDVESARAALEDAYREAGYGTALVSSPEQGVDAGFVTLEVSEGRVSRLRVTGSRYFSLGRIRERVPALAEGQTPNLAEAQAQLVELNAMSPDRSVTPVLRAGKTPGTVEVDLQVEDRTPLHAELELNDRFAPDTTRTRLNGTVRYDNLWQREHSAGFSFQITPEDPSEVRVLSGTYVFRYPGSNKVVALYLVDSNTDIASVGTFGVLGAGTIVGGRLIVPLTATTGDAFFHSLALGADYKDFRREDIFQELGEAPLRAPISYHRFSAAYGGGFRTAHSQSNWNVETAFGLRGLGNLEGEFANRRFQGEPNYLYFRGNLSHTQNILAGFQGVLRVVTQAAISPLIANEQFNIGGVESVRGYAESKALGDDGVSMTLELRSPRLAPAAWSQLRTLYAYVFTDAGWVRVQSPLPGLGDTIDSFDLSSGGFGVAGSLLDELYFAFDLAVPFATSVVAVADDGDPTTQAQTSNADVRPGDTRAHFKVGYKF